MGGSGIRDAVLEGINDGRGVILGSLELVTVPTSSAASTAAFRPAIADRRLGRFPKLVDQEAKFATRGDLMTNQLGLRCQRSACCRFATRTQTRLHLRGVPPVGHRELSACARCGILTS